MQVIVTYLLYKLYVTNNYLRQTLTLMLFIVFSSIYLAFWQLELFACFLFLGEFTILIFFYCLFLHLKIFINKPIGDLNNLLNPITLILIILLSYMWAISINIIHSAKNFIFDLISDVYKHINDFTLNDLISIYYYFANANVFIHLLIGLILFLLTIFLFTIVTLYTNSKLTKNTVYTTTILKLNVKKGYYEQTANTVQKYFSNNIK